ncbi:Uncharacterized protein ChrSV_0246 [Chromobacterium vaccinii]|nr:Uncharacterized protein ChrSW_0246 [Chromobacterium vaccinii]QND87705.1 Uncharacterized protein ChrSV_0246 [Chromobacterium vaccinii]
MTLAESAAAGKWIAATLIRIRCLAGLAFRCLERRWQRGQQTG